MKKFFIFFVMLSILFAAPVLGAPRTYNTKPVLTNAQIKALKARRAANKNITDADTQAKGLRKTTRKSTSERVLRQKQIIDIGYKLLNENKIDKRMTFAYSLSYKNPNAYVNLKTREIVVNKGLMDMISTDDELAFIIGHEISHAVDSYWGPMDGLFYNPQFNFVHRRIETRSDLRSIDFMVKAGYNPVASLIMSNKLFDQPITDFFRTHPAGNKRLATMYVYIKNTYPEFLKDSEYTKNPVYKNILISCQQDIEKVEMRLEEEAQRELMKKE